MHAKEDAARARARPLPHPPNRARRESREQDCVSTRRHLLDIIYHYVLHIVNIRLDPRHLVLFQARAVVVHLLPERRFSNLLYYSLSEIL